MAPSVLMYFLLKRSNRCALYYWKVHHKVIYSLAISIDQSVPVISFQIYRHDENVDGFNLHGKDNLINLMKLS